MNGFRRLSPGASRASHIRVALSFLVGAALCRRSVWRAFAYLIRFHCDFRPGELANLKAAQVIAPVAGRTTWGFLLAPSEEQIGSKTGQLDESAPDALRARPEGDVAAQEEQVNCRTTS